LVIVENLERNVTVERVEIISNHYYM